VGRSGGNNARDVQHWWHTQLGVNSNKRLTWDDQLIGRRNSFGGEFRIATERSSGAIRQLWSFGYQKNLLLEEFFTRTHLVWGSSKPKAATCSLDFLFARPLGGELNDNYTKTRFESGFACRLFSAYAPAVRYVSPYVVGESYPQIYYDLFNLQFEL
jgi:hypothetical protein